MDALTLLKADHEAVETKFARFEALGPRALKSKATVADVIEALSVHAAIEEQVLYPAVRDRLADDEGQILEALEEHHVVKWTLSELDGMSPDHERFDAKFTVLIETVRHHVKEEESDLFPKVRRAFTRTELADLGEALAQAKATAPTKPHPSSPDEPPMNEVAAAVTNPFDTVWNRRRSHAPSARHRHPRLLGHPTTGGLAIVQVTQPGVAMVSAGSKPGGIRELEPYASESTSVPCRSFTLVDRQGCEVLSRPLVQADRPTVARLFPGLSAQTRFHRFNSLFPTLSAQQLTSLFDLDYRDRFAWAVEITCDRVTGPVAVGRYARYPGSRRADVGITIRDDWQGRGLGGALLDTLTITAHHYGFVAFDTIVTADNEAMLHLLQQRGAELSAPTSGEVDVVLPLSRVIGQLADHPLSQTLTIACTARNPSREAAAGEPGLRRAERGGHAEIRRQVAPRGPTPSNTPPCECSLDWIFVGALVDAAKARSSRARGASRGRVDPWRFVSHRSTNQLRRAAPLTRASRPAPTQSCGPTVAISAGHSVAVAVSCWGGTSWTAC
jgi:hemerythrin superfamily protein/RimJ/RimL family protein N-acetyltransferase